MVVAVTLPWQFTVVWGKYCMEKHSLGNAENAYAFYQEQWEEEAFLEEPSVVMKFCGIEQCLPGHGYGPARRECFLIHFILDGRGVYEYHGEKFHLEKGQSFLIYPDECVQYQADISFPWKYCWIGFEGKNALKLIEKIGYTREMPVCSFSNTESIEEDVSGIISHNGKENSDHLRRRASFLFLLADLLDEAEERSLPGPDRRENKEQKEEAGFRFASRTYSVEAIRYLETHFREKIRIQNLAQEIGISRSYLTQQIKEAIGMSPRTLLINIRMEHALIYLEKSNDPIQLVALECGYDDALAFSKAFKARYGMSPTKYRQEKQREQKEQQ